MSPKSDAPARDSKTTPNASNPTSDSKQPPALKVAPEPVDPHAVLRQLADHMARNPFATDRKTVMVGAQGRALTTAMERLKSLADECARIELEIENVARNALAILAGTHPGLSAGGPGKSTTTTGDKGGK